MMTTFTAYGITLVSVSDNSGVESMIATTIDNVRYTSLRSRTPESGTMSTISPLTRRIDIASDYADYLMSEID